jgi:cytochrome c oxidase subunit 3
LNQVAEATAHSHIHRDDVGAKIGMWLFLFTELILFGGMFLVYAVYRFSYRDYFALASKELDVFVGLINTLVLLTSSLTMAMSITALRKGNKRLSLLFLGTTIFFALLFLVNKYFEWSAKFAHGLFPGSNELLTLPRGEIIYFGLYYVMTGLHAIHVIIGLVILVFMFVFIIKDKVNQDYYIMLENSGLYWHLVDIIWIFLFPLFYLIH